MIIAPDRVRDQPAARGVFGLTIGVETVNFTV